jgi:two-component system OmpR family response regulator
MLSSASISPARDAPYGFGQGNRLTKKILLVEDDETTADYIASGLEQNGYVVDRASNGRDGLFHATDGNYAAVVLDRMLPGMEGLAVLSAMRAAGIETPVIILSALGTTDERVKGLKAGSDDYLAKPFAFSELLARIEALQRRGPAESQKVATNLQCADLEMDLLTRRVDRGGKRVDLQPREFRLLELLLRNQGHVVTRTMMLEEVWDYHFDPGTNVIDVHISRLRKKIDEESETPLLHTVRGVGYMLSEQA